MFLKIDAECKENFYSYVRYCFRFSLFMFMGAGANWVFPTALAQQIPFFETVAPEQYNNN
jgi:hypothetical protein